MYYLGGYTSIPDGSPVSKLEIVTRMGGQSPKRKLGPAHANVLVQPLRFDPAWVGAVTGQVENDYAADASREGWAWAEGWHDSRQERRQQAAGAQAEHRRHDDRDGRHAHPTQGEALQEAALRTLGHALHI